VFIPHSVLFVAEKTNKLGLKHTCQILGIAEKSPRDLGIAMALCAANYSCHDFVKSLSVKTVNVKPLPNFRLMKVIFLSSCFGIRLYQPAIARLRIV
jgi:hypothetical protein